jgi:cyclic pyranopterin monophosphate synthase
MKQKEKKQNQGMIDVTHKNQTKRKAIATAQIKMSKKAFKALMDGQSPKGDVLETAKMAGIMAAKSTPSIIPMCHPLELGKISVAYEIDQSKCIVRISAEVLYLGRTGVEMEALTAVSVAGLTIYDMMKWADKSMVISEVKLLHKSGGKSGDYTRKK